MVFTKQDILEIAKKLRLVSVKDSEFEKVQIPQDTDKISILRQMSDKTYSNLLSNNDVYLQSAFNAYKLGGGTKYTTESAFNAQFAKVIDMTVTQ